MSTVRENDLRNLVYKLCEGREVPLLVTDLIAGYLIHRDLFSINGLSRSLNVQANAIIYQDIEVYLNGNERPRQTASLLFRTLLTSETAARSVRTLSLAGDPLQDWRQASQERDSESIEGPLRGKTPPDIYADLTDFTQREIELYDNLAASSSTSLRPPNSKVPVWALYLQLPRLTPHIQDFSVSSDYFRFPGFRSALQDMARDSSLEELRSCSLCLDLLRRICRHASVVSDWDGVLLALFALPSMQSIAAVASLNSEAVRQLRPGGSSITRLDLHHYQMPNSDISSLLAATPTLRYLKYHATTDHGWIPSPRHAAGTVEYDFGLEPLYKALHHVSDSLQELHTSHEFDEDSLHFDPAYAVEYEPLFRQREELSSLKQLQALTIPYATLLGWRRKDCQWDWDKILPFSLRQIVLTDSLQESCYAEPWTDDNLMPVISGLVEWLSAPQRGNEAAEFGLRLTKVKSDFNEPARHELTRICEERGVRFSIEKVHADRPRPRLRAALGPRGRGTLARGRGRGRGS